VMQLSYARVSTEDDQGPALQLSALKQVGCRQTFVDERFVVPRSSTLPSSAASRNLNNELMDGSAVAGDRSPTLQRTMRPRPLVSGMVCITRPARPPVSASPIRSVSGAIRRNGTGVRV